MGADLPILNGIRRAMEGGQIVVLTTAYLPPVDYIAAIAKARVALLEAHENYQKQSYRNRAEVVGANGVERLVVPVVRPYGTHTPIKEVGLSRATRWVEQHLGAIQSCYGQSAFFIHYYPEIERILRCKWPTLWALNDALLRFMLDRFGVRTEILETEEYIHAYPPAEALDLRNAFHPKRPRPANKEYFQAFADRLGFQPNMSGIDLLLQEGML